MSNQPQESHKLAEELAERIACFRGDSMGKGGSAELACFVDDHRDAILHALRSSEQRDARGYANLGIGAYRIDHSRAGEVPELCITPATEHDRATRTVGDSVDNEPGSQIEAKDMLIRIGFANEAGLRALETQLRILREVHFPAAIAASGGAKGDGNG